MNKSLLDQVAAILQGIDAEQTAEANGWWETSDGAKFGAEKLRELRALLDGCDSMPVGVPDGYALVPVEPTDEMRDAGNVYTLNRSTLFRSWHAMLAAAPTVKAEQVPALTGERLYGMWVSASGLGADPWDVVTHEHNGWNGLAARLTDAAHSLPAAGSAVEEAEVVGYTYATHSGAYSQYGGDDWLPMMTVAQHNRIVAALSAQQSAQDEAYPPCDYCGVVPDYHPWHGSGLFKGAENPHIHACNDCRHLLPSAQSAPERVSVPVALLRVACSGGNEAWQALEEIRALLASHGRGEA